MEFRAPGQSNERRRRVKTDDSGAATLPLRRKARSGEESARGKRYADQGRPDRQPRLVDLIPRRRLWQNVIAVVGGIAIAGLLAAHWATHRAGVTIPAAVVKTFDVTASDSIAAWGRAAVLASAAGMALLVYIVRRHRTDDYRGGYRIWLWAAAWLMAMSIDVVAGLRAAWQAAWIAETQWTGPLDGSLWWLMPCLLAGITLGVRLVLEMRECRASTIWFVVASVVWLTGEMLGAVGVTIVDSITSQLVFAGCTLVGQWSLLVSMNWHARHVLLDASGALWARKKKKKVRRESTSTSEEPAAKRESAPATETRRPEPVRERPAPVNAPVAAKPQVPAKPQTPSKPAEPQRSTFGGLASTLTFGGRATTPASSQGESQNQQLSKAERKQLKREMRRAA
jgi:hypothetical protein